MYNSSIIKLDEKTTDRDKIDSIKRMSLIIQNYFDSFSPYYVDQEINYRFQHTETLIDEIPVSIIITRYVDFLFYNRPENINKYGIFKIEKISQDNESGLDSGIRLNNDQINIYRELAVLYDIQENNYENEEILSNLQNSIKDVIEKAKLIDNHSFQLCFNQPDIPLFLRNNNNINFGLYNSQLRDENISKYILTAEVSEDIKKNKQYFYRSKIICDTFTLINGDIYDNFILAKSTDFHLLEDAIESLQWAIESFKFFDDSLLSINDFEKAVLEREIFPLNKDFNCCICLNPTKGITLCKHRICFKCRFQQVNTGTSSKRNRCPICRKKNILNYFNNNNLEYEEESN